MIEETPRSRSERKILAGKPITMMDAGLRLNAALGRAGATAAASLGAHASANLVFAWAAAKEVTSFKVWCEVMETDPQPSLARMDRSSLPIDEFLTRERSRLALAKFDSGVSE